jgi:hypothetical protein
MPRRDPLPSSVLDKPACGTGTWPSVPNERSWTLPLICDAGAARESFEKSTTHTGLCGQRVSRQGALWAIRAPPARRPTRNRPNWPAVKGRIVTMFIPFGFRGLT